MKQGYIDLYYDSYEQAKRAADVERWARSLAENIACAKAIEQAIFNSANNYRIDRDTVQGVIEKFGHNRVNWVLAAAIQQDSHEDWISEENKEWAAGFKIPALKTEAADYMIISQSGSLNAFVSQARREWQELGLFSHGHCAAGDVFQGCKDKVLVLRPELIRDGKLSPNCQLVLATGEFNGGNYPGDHNIHGILLHNGQKCVIPRLGFIGVMDDLHLPWWARDKLEDLTRAGMFRQPEQDDREQIQEQSGAEEGPGFSM